MSKDKILVTGARGQIGTALVEKLRQIYGENAVLATDLKPEKTDDWYATLDVTDKDRLNELVTTHQITQIYHLAAILSAAGEKNPLLTWRINMEGSLNVLEIGREKKLDKIYIPSSIAVFGDRTPDHTPQHTILNPGTVYGISKVAGELWGEYYFQRYGLDVRALRYPGIISYETLPGGGTTDYAVDIFYKAVAGEHFTCFLKNDTSLPMMYMADALRATTELMESPLDQVRYHGGYNVCAMSFNPEELAAAIRKYIPEFTMSYEIDPVKQHIAETWSDSIDDSLARQHWGWKEAYDLDAMTKDMIANLRKKLVRA